jgi:signal transduction histidine kinase
MGLFLLKNNYKNPVNRNLAITILLFCFWAFNDLMQWLVHDIKLNLFFTRLSAPTSLTILFLLYFVYAFTGKVLSRRKKIFLALPFLPIIILTFSDLSASIPNLETCTPNFGMLYWYIYFLLFVYLVLAIRALISSHKEENISELKKQQVKLVIGAIAFILSWFLIFLPLSNYLINNYDIEWFSMTLPYGMLFFIGILTYAISEYKLFNLKLIAAQALVVGLVILIGSEFFFIRSTTNIILTLITLLIALGFGYMLVKSVKKEVEQKEALEIANKEINEKNDDLKVANKEISERKEELQKISDNLSIANDKLHQLDKAKSEFISIASHQLRTPPTSIKGFGSLILEGTYGEISDPVRRAVEKMYISNERQLHLVEDLLNISRIEAGRMEFAFQPEQIENLVNEVVMTLELSAKNNNLYLQWQKPQTPLPQLNIDATKIKEVISNMVDNAVKYTKKGGVTVRAENDGQSVRIIVSDTGIGMDKEELENIFEKFRRGKDVSRHNTDGTGLGMFIAKKVTDAHNGKIWAESDGKGMGSRFILELPIVFHESSATAS